MNMTLTQVIARETAIFVIAGIFWILGSLSHKYDIRANDTINLPRFIGIFFGKSTNPFSLSGMASQIMGLITVVAFNLPLLNILTMQVAIRIYAVLFLILGIIIGLARVSRKRI